MIQMVVGRIRRVLRPLAAAVPVLAAALALAPDLAAQASGTIRGVVTRQDDKTPLQTVSVLVAGTGLAATTGADGRYVIQRVPEGEATVVFRWPGYRPYETKVSVKAGQTTALDVALEAEPVALGELVVEAASRAPERVVEAPAAVAVIDPYVTATMSVTGQAPLALQTVPGVDLAQNGVNDFNVNARGLNSTLNRRVLVLQDGRDLAVAFLGNQEWYATSVPLEDVGRMEMVRGPGSALFGANAFNGVLNIVTPRARDIAGTKLSLAGGELDSWRADFRHAGVFSEGRFGYRLNVGYNTSDTWTRSRTALDGRDMAREYAPVTDSTVRTFGNNLNAETVALKGQARDPSTGAAVGDRDPLQNWYGSARVDYYATNGSVGTIEGGYADTRNETVVTGIGRVQVLHATRPWVRAAWDANNFNLMAYYNGRDTKEPQRALGTGADLLEASQIYHVEGQYNRGFAGDKLKMVLGTSYRSINVNTSATLMQAADDDRSDHYASAYGQLEYRLGTVKLVGATRFDDGNLIKPQWSPKAAVVWSPSPNHSFRGSYNRAFQTPNYSEFFLRVNARPATASPRQLESGIEGYYAAVKANLPAAALAGLNLPADLPWNFSAATRILALGNRNLDVETINGWEVGYKGQFGTKAFLSVDLYLNKVNNFVTDLLPAITRVNPDYAPYSLAGSGVNIPADFAALDARLASLGLPANHPLRAPIQANGQLTVGYNTLNAQLGPLLSTVNGERTGVITYGQAGSVKQRGIEVGFGYHFTPEFHGEVGYTFFDTGYFLETLTGVQTGDLVQPNTPKHKGSISLSYVGRQGLDFGGTFRVQEGYQWAAGVFAGWVPSQTQVNLNAGYKINSSLRVFANAVNLFNQEVYSVFAGSVNARRVLGGITATF